LLFCSTNATFCCTNEIILGVQYKFFGMQEKKFEHAVQTFATSLPPYGKSFAALRHMYWVLSPYGACFAALCYIFEAQCKSLWHFSMGGGV
jgi:hypothetical protein